MRSQLLLPVSLVVSIALVFVIKIRKIEKEKEEKRNGFNDIKLRVTNDVLGEIMGEEKKMQELVQETSKKHEALQMETVVLTDSEDTAKGNLDTCRGEQKTVRDQLAKIEADVAKLKADSDKEAATWKTEQEALRQKLAGWSPVCDFLNAGSFAGKLCGQEAPKPEEPKVEAPKPEEPKAEAPKPEEPNAEAPKPEEPNAEAPKPEEPNAEAPKPEEPKAEAPKPEEPKAEAAK